MPKSITSFRGKYSFLSNFYSAPVVMDYILYPTAEHGFQAAKTLDKFERSLIRNTSTPGKAKRLGRKVTLRPEWDDMRVEVMENILRSKFENPELKAKLVKTGSRELIEGNTWGDRFWGQVNGDGRNELGKLLMKLRAEFQEAK